MRQKLNNFALGLGLTITDTAWDTLNQYVDLVWEKKEVLNLTSVADKNEIFTRHIADAFPVASICKELPANSMAADMGTGAGYIGITMAVLCPHVRVTLVESLQKRCTFLNWTVLKLGLKNVTVCNIRLGQETPGSFDLVTERAMGQINDILPLLVPCVKKGGTLVAYQSQPGQADEALVTRLGIQSQNPIQYILPDEMKTRYLAVFSLWT